MDDQNTRDDFELNAVSKPELEDRSKRKGLHCLGEEKHRHHHTVRPIGTGQLDYRERPPTHCQL